MSFHAIFEPYVAELGVEHPIDYELREGTIASVFEVEEGRHRIAYHSRVNPADLEEFNPKRPFLGNFVHELCHLHLAEKISPSFSGITHEERSETDIKQLATIDNTVVDMWVNDLFHQRFPGLFEAHHKAFADTTGQHIKAKHWRTLLPPTVPHTLTHSEADAIRHDLVPTGFRRLLQTAGFDKKQLSSSAGRDLHGMFNPDVVRHVGLKPIDKLWDYLRQQDGEETPRTMNDIGPLRDLLVDTPPITYDRNEAIKTHQEVVKRYSQVGRFTIQPKLVDEQPRPCWYFE